MVGHQTQTGTGVAGIKPVRKKMALLLKHLQRLSALQQEAEVRRAGSGPVVFDLEADVAREKRQQQQQQSSSLAAAAAAAAALGDRSQRKQNG